MIIKHLPNLVSALRLAAAPLAAWAILADHDTLALVVFVAASFSDAVDGFAARRWGVTTRFGAWLDPAADKFLMLTCFLALLKIGVVPLWLAVLVVARDIVIAGGAVLAKLLGLPLRVAPLGIGKAATLVQVAYLGICLLLQAFDQEWPHLLRAGSYTVAVFLLLSAAAYAQLFLRAVWFGRRTA